MPLLPSSSSTRFAAVLLAGLVRSVSAACVADADCVDTNPCSVDTCSAGECRNQPPIDAGSVDCLFGNLPACAAAADGLRVFLNSPWQRGLAKIDEARGAQGCRQRVALVGSAIEDFDGYRIFVDKSFEVGNLTEGCWGPLRLLARDATTVAKGVLCGAPPVPGTLSSESTVSQVPGRPAIVVECVRLTTTSADVCMAQGFAPPPSTAAPRAVAATGSAEPVAVTRQVRKRLKRGRPSKRFKLRLNPVGKMLLRDAPDGQADVEVRLSLESGGTPSLLVRLIRLVRP